MATVLVGCNKNYFNAMETMGYHKHGVLVARVKEARDAFQDSQKQFQGTLKELTAIANNPASDTQTLVKKLSSELDHSESTAKSVHKHVSDVEQAARGFFQDEAKKLNKEKDEAKRLQRRRDLERDRAEYFIVLKAMRRAESTLTPVLIRLRTQILYVNRNPSTKSFTYLKDNLGTLEADVTSLVREMKTAVTTCDAYIQARKSNS